MGVVATSQVLYDGINTTVIQFTGVADSADQELNAVKVKMSDLNPVPKTVKVLDVDYDINNGKVQMAWDADTPVPFMIAGAGPGDDFDYRFIGGMPNGGGDTATGNILFSTIGFDAGSSYSIKLELRKKY